MHSCCERLETTFYFVSVSQCHRPESTAMVTTCIKMKAASLWKIFLVVNKWMAELSQRLTQLLTSLACEVTLLRLELF